MHNFNFFAYLFVITSKSREKNYQKKEFWVFLKFAGVWERAILKRQIQKSANFEVE